jgi:hypothetical protein
VITPNTTSVKGCRADFEGLVWEGEEHHHSARVHANITVRRSPEGQQVVTFFGGVTDPAAPLSDVAAEIIASAAVSDGGHLIVGFGADLPEGFAQALDAASGGRLTITMLVPQGMSDAEKAIPMPDPVAAQVCTLILSEEDFEQFSDESFQWARTKMVDAPNDYFEAVGRSVNELTDRRWEMAYGIAGGPGGWANTLMAVSFLRALGEEYELAYAPGEDGGQYFILTDFRTAMWKQVQERNVIRDAEKEAAFRELTASE